MQLSKPDNFHLRNSRWKPVSRYIINKHMSMGHEIYGKNSQYKLCNVNTSLLIDSNGRARGLSPIIQKFKRLQQN